MAIENNNRQVVIEKVSSTSGKTGLMHQPAQGEAGSENVMVTTASISTAHVKEKDTDLVGFFAIGMLINLAIVVAFFNWAYKQWK